MSKQHKNARKLATAKQFKMKKGPARTCKTNTKVKTWWRVAKFRTAAPAKAED